MSRGGAIVGAVVVVAAFAALNLAAASAQPTATLVVDEPAYVPLAPAETAPIIVDPHALLAEHGEPDVIVVWSDDAAVNCGLTLGEAGGCFNPATPDTIVVSTNNTPAGLTYLVLHELAHLRQHRYGVPLDECAADAAAVAWGADEALAHYLPECEGAAS